MSKEDFYENTKNTAIVIAAAMGMGCFHLNVLATDSLKEAEKVDCYKGYRNFLYRLCRKNGTIQNT